MTLFAKTKSFYTKSSPTWPPLSTGYSGVCGAALWLCAGGRGEETACLLYSGTLPCRRGLRCLCWKWTDWKDPMEDVFFLQRASWYRDPTLNKLERGVDGLAAVPLLVAMAPPAWETSSAGWCHTRLAQQNPRPLLWNRSISRVNWLNNTTPC